ncbi:MAG TPA: hypothetical protein QF468_03325 [Nitrospinota bacterium]|jgi:hypothetical protein|nr:hypothetical protein [Nitrospinota bacterium]|tara:strand:- start:2390 stop:2581 length:192 start_codon:yes stop_codon:yes gene_type:complete
MNKFEFDKLISELETLTDKGQHIYAMKAYKAYPVAWSVFIRNVDYAVRQYIEDDNLKIEVCFN